SASPAAAQHAETPSSAAPPTGAQPVARTTNTAPRPRPIPADAPATGASAVV
ncbi:hypothetical protein, partial [Leucobacter sp. M11]|uniref:hypothetical protein n=1 Tax=Leucobacter sp. M11 TaxID=2993565 RepID=UPI002D7E9852